MDGANEADLNSTRLDNAEDDLVKLVNNPWNHVNRKFIGRAEIL